jgi:hypothetical protein
MPFRTLDLEPLMIFPGDLPAGKAWRAKPASQAGREGRSAREGRLAGEGRFRDMA